VRFSDVVSLMSTAMAVVHWLPDRDRVLRFLGKHAELLCEGHECLDVERARLKAIGFAEVRVLGETERGRYLLHARRLECPERVAT